MAKESKYFLREIDTKDNSKMVFLMAMVSITSHQEQSMKDRSKTMHFKAKEPNISKMEIANSANGKRISLMVMVLSSFKMVKNTKDSS